MLNYFGNFLFSFTFEIKSFRDLGKYNWKYDLFLRMLVQIFNFWKMRNFMEKIMENFYYHWFDR